MHIFLDSSVLLSFCRSKKGASALILDYCRAGKLVGFISQKVILEVRKNNDEDGNKLGTLRFLGILKQNFLVIVEDAQKKEEQNAYEVTKNKKDAIIFATAKSIIHIAFLLSFDNGFFKQEVKAFLKPIEVLKPGEFVNRFREKLEG